jgi:hypothetical protein
MSSRRVLGIAFVVIVFAIVLYAGWKRPQGPSTFEAAFQPGGTVNLDLAVGRFAIRGTDENQIRVAIDPSDARYVHSTVLVNGTTANVKLKGPSNNFGATIYVPKQVNLNVTQTVGQMRIVNVEGDKNVGLNVGQIIIPMPEDTQWKRVDADVNIGSVNARPWHTEMGGFFRSFHASGQGAYSISAHLDIGEISLE